MNLRNLLSLRITTKQLHKIKFFFVSAMLKWREYVGTLFEELTAGFVTAITCWKRYH